MARRRWRPGGKYSPLRQYLGAATGPTLTLSFGFVEAVLGETLPRSAYTSRGWWSDSHNDSQTASWRAAGWRMACVDLQEQTVTFVRQPTPQDSTT